ncbi:hypothetical protein [Actinoplanes solisilvae]|uniref:hypothetical protein n=1 Tax=Actinoplanes solisilvae TaxID=2486853 RepID=UPI0013E352CE|nr:hypothetical protein [Actinoplanes solisilvae]
MVFDSHASRLIAGWVLRPADMAARIELVRRLTGCVTAAPGDQDSRVQESRLEVS